MLEIGILSIDARKKGYLQHLLFNFKFLTNAPGQHCPPDQNPPPPYKSFKIR